MRELKEYKLNYDNKGVLELIEMLKDIKKWDDFYDDWFHINVKENFIIRYNETYKDLGDIIEWVNTNEVILDIIYSMSNSEIANYYYS